MKLDIRFEIDKSRDKRSNQTRESSERYFLCFIDFVVLILECLLAKLDVTLTCETRTVDNTNYCFEITLLLYKFDG